MVSPCSRGVVGPTATAIATHPRLPWPDQGLLSSDAPPSRRSPVLRHDLVLYDGAIGGVVFKHRHGRIVQRGGVARVDEQVAARVLVPVARLLDAEDELHVRAAGEVRGVLRGEDLRRGGARLRARHVGRSLGWFMAASSMSAAASLLLHGCPMPLHSGTPGYDSLRTQQASSADEAIHTSAPTSAAPLSVHLALFFDRQRVRRVACGCHLEPREGEVEVRDLRVDGEGVVGVDLRGGDDDGVRGGVPDRLPLVKKRHSEGRAIVDGVGRRRHCEEGSGQQALWRTMTEEPRCLVWASDKQAGVT